MKKVLLATLLFLGVAATSFAQDGGKFSIGVEAGLPVGSASDVSSFAIGGSLKYALPIAEKTAFTASAGYTFFSYKSDIKNALKALGVNDKGQGFIPVKLGIKYDLADALYAEGQLGATFITTSGADKKVAFAYAPGIGYKFSDVLDLGVRYEGWSVSGGTTSQIAARLGFSF
ncbi:outer membrane beta-barrel protein [Mucilaginibacter auburnensis]|uniref:Outer membrane protein with beta-barrel domain n=1 Tax=Mucilaginibacter auburnensis TaxID=1457233 RepID=A0A2H9VPB6_9SPHI|nr:outer membrane beta-barrel protein [Mucilaginibacter auburnensis]PJJ80166.1 outer membrane protein with beta-barrel domain [Mucilaginibacter auburnensis]